MIKKLFGICCLVLCFSTLNAQMDVFLKSGKLLDSVIVYAPGSIEHEYIPKQKQVYEYNEKGFQTQALFYNCRITSYNVCYTKLLRLFAAPLFRDSPLPYRDSVSGGSP